MHQETNITTTNVNDIVYADERIDCRIKLWPDDPYGIFASLGVVDGGNLDHVGTWEVFGYYTFCPYAPHGYRCRRLGYVYGPYWKVLNTAANMPGFFELGALRLTTGGSLRYLGGNKVNEALETN